MYIILKLCKVRVTIVFFGVFLLQNDKFISDLIDIVAEKNRGLFFIFQPQIKRVMTFFTFDWISNFILHLRFVKKYLL